MRKSFTAAVLVLGMALGSVLTMAFNPIGAASALVSGSSAKGTHESVLQQALDTLVGKGTITQSQADAVQGQVQADRDAMAAKLPHFGSKLMTEIAVTLKITPKELWSELHHGKTLAQVATAHGVNPTTLANQITAGLQKQISARVAAHRLQSQFATIMQQHLSARVDALMNHSFKHAQTSTSKPATSGSTTTTTH
jgi:hypothetical protein